MKFHMWVSALLLLLGSTIDAQFNEHPKNVTTEPGQEVILRCLLTNTPTTGCFWSFKKYYNSDPKYFSPTGTEYAYVTNQPNSDCSMKILNAQLQNDGFYRCGLLPSTVNEQRTFSDEAKVSILDLPEDPIIQFNGNAIENRILKTFDNEPITVKCVVKNGNPEAKIKWYIDSTEQYNNVNTTAINSTYQYLLDTVSEINITMGDIYQQKFLSCNATHDSYEIYNVTDNTLSAVVVLVMPGPVKWAIGAIGNGSVQSIDAKYGQKISLNCTSFADPEPEYIWQRTDDYNSNQWEQIGKQAVIDYPAQSGYYRCGAKNNDNGGEYVYSEEELRMKVPYTEDSGLSAGAIAGITIGCFFFVALLIGIIFYMYRKGKLCFRRRPPMASTRRHQPTVPTTHAPKHPETQPLREIHHSPHHVSHPVVQEYKDKISDKSTNNDDSTLSVTGANSVH